MFELLVAISQVDDVLGTVLKGVLSKGHGESWEPDKDESVDQWIYQKYAAELYGVVVSLTGGEARSVVKSLSDVGGFQDCFKALVLLCSRFDAKTAASLLHAFTEVVRPKDLKASEVSKGIQAWEGKLGALKSRYNEDLNGNIKLAILIGMLPREYQDLVLNTSVLSSQVSYEAMRDNVLRVANQRMHMAQPTPMDIGAMQENVGEEGEQLGDEWGCGYGYGEEWDTMAVGKGSQCYDCKGFCNFARECPKGKGKGGFGVKGKGKGDFGKGLKGQYGWRPKGGGKNGWKG